jgi:DNA helicase-2/ATP-dependent DNA helicase PcrA
MDEISWMRALTLCPGIGPGYATKIFDAFRKGNKDLEKFLSGIAPASIGKKAKSGYNRFLKIMRAIIRGGAEGLPGDMIQEAMDAGYENHVLTSFENAKDRIDDIHELVNFSHDYKSLQEFLSDITLRENFRGETVLGGREEDEVLVLTTIHQAKGLEWDAVIIIGLCEGQFPHPKAMRNDAEIEEERRLFYVASTRAKKFLYLMHPATRFDYQMGTVVARKSRFIEELKADDYEVWEVSSQDASGNDLKDRGENDFEITYQDDDTIIEI